MSTNDAIPARAVYQAITANIESVMRERLPKDILEILKQVGRVAAELKFSAYVVGGFVRDLLLKHENLDIDIVIEGDAIVFARRLPPLGRLASR